MLVNYSLIFVSLLLFAGLGIDAGLLERSYLQLQGAAQAAAAGSSVALQRGGSSSTITSAGQAAAAMNGYTNGTNGVTVTIANPPSTGTYAGNSSAVLATINAAVPTTFLGILGMGNVNMKATAQAVAPTLVNLSSFYNVTAIYTDGTSIPDTGGFDGSGYAYSANALGEARASNNLGALISWRGNLFTLGAPNTKNGVANTTVTLPSGNYSQLLIVASTAFGPLTETWNVYYSDNSYTSLTQNMSDWCNPQFYSGETVVVQASYRDAEPWGASTPTENELPNCIYGYSINLDSSKTLSKIVLPATRQVVVFAIGLKK